MTSAFQIRPCFAAAALMQGCTGAHVQAGPMVGYSPTRGATWGWEAGVGELGVVRVSTGGSYRIEEEVVAAPEATDGTEPARARTLSQTKEETPVPPQLIHYVAFEPVALTIGVAIPSNREAGFMGGLWGGWIYDPNPQGAFGGGPDRDRLRPNLDCPDYDPEPALLLSGAIGVRYLTGDWEIYLTPKAAVFYCVEFGN